MWRLSHVRWGWRGLVLLAATTLLANCGGELTPPRLVHFSPVVLLVPTEESIALRVVYEENDYELTGFAWMVEAGEVEGGSGADIVYTAPAEPGNYRVTVTAAYGEAETVGELTLETVIKVIPGASRLMAEETSEPEPAQAAAERAAEGEVAEDAAATPGDVASDQGTSNDPVEPRAEAAEPATAEASETSTTRTEPATAEASDGAPAQTAPQTAATAEPASDDAPAVAPVVAAGGSRLDRILGDGQLTAVVQTGFRPFSFEEEGDERAGFDVDLVREFARRWLEDPDAVTLVPVPTSERIPKLLAGEADIIAAALTKTPARAEQVDFGLTYFKDGQRLLVRDGSEVASVCDLAGQQIAAIEGSTSLDNLRQEATACGFEPGESIVVFERHADAVTAVLDGQVAAFTSDGVALEGFAANAPLEVVGNHFSEEPYGIAVPKGDRRLRELVDATLAAMAEDGTFAAIYAKWFGDAIAPYPLEVPNLSAARAELEALITSDAPPLFEGEDEVAAEGIREYVVQPGDTLSKIAGKLYGDVAPGSWQRIYDANREAIGDDPSRIRVGMTLAIPAAER